MDFTKRLIFCCWHTLNNQLGYWNFPLQWSLSFVFDWFWFSVLHFSFLWHLQLCTLLLIHCILIFITGAKCDSVLCCFLPAVILDIQGALVQFSTLRRFHSGEIIPHQKKTTCFWPGLVWFAPDCDYCVWIGQNTPTQKMDSWSVHLHWNLSIQFYL